jgi:IS30 family transposase
MRDNSGENKSHEMIEFFESLGVDNYFSAANEKWQNGLQESAINSTNHFFFSENSHFFSEP